MNVNLNLKVNLHSGFPVEGAVSAGFCRESVLRMAGTRVGNLTPLCGPCCVSTIRFEGQENKNSKIDSDSFGK